MVSNRIARKEFFTGHFERYIFCSKHDRIGKGFAMIENIVLGAVYIAALITLYFVW